MNRQEVLRSGHGSGANEDLGRNLREGIVRTIQKKLPSWVPGSKSARSASSDRPKNPPSDNISKETALDSRHIIDDVLPHNPNDRRPVITYGDIKTIMDWAQHPDVKGHIYQLESGPEELYQGEQREWLYWEYYRGNKDDEGKFTKPENSTFFKAVNNKGQMIAVTTVRWKAVEFVKRGRTAYWERLIVNPELLERKIGLAFGIEVLDNIFYKSDKYDGIPATEVRASAFADRIAGHHDINHNYLTLLGFKKHGNPIWVNDRHVQPYKMSLADYEEARPKALEHMAIDQPERMAYLERQGEILQAKLSERTQE